MKQRSGFVSNSSAASFVVALSVLTVGESRAILQFDEWNMNRHKKKYVEKWGMTHEPAKGVITGFTTMDNGELRQFLKERGLLDRVTIERC
jgi:hypothetical protein